MVRRAGKRTKGPLTVPDYRHMPWYVAHAFNSISQYYKDVDDSKLKRGRREYQQFLQELRNADPEAFAPESKTKKECAGAWQLSSAALQTAGSKGHDSFSISRVLSL